MKDEQSGRLAELNSYHRDIDTCFGAGLGGFITAHQSPLTHQPTKGALPDPAAWQHFEASNIIGMFDNLDCQFGAKPLDPLGGRLAVVAASHPQDSESGEPAQDPAKKDLCGVAFGGASLDHGDAEHQPQGVHQQMSLAAFDRNRPAKPSYVVG
jgi:hypothetical protein